MARALGYGGLGNTNGARSFSGKEEVIVAAGGIRRGRYFHSPSSGKRVWRPWLEFSLATFFVLLRWPTLLFSR
jgi:hypothetical protein